MVRKRSDQPRKPLVPVVLDVLTGHMKAKKLTTYRLAKAADVKRQTLDYIVKGRIKRMRLDKAVKLAAAIGVDVAKLTGQVQTTPQARARSLHGVKTEDLRATNRELGRTRIILETQAVWETLQAVLPTRKDKTTKGRKQLDELQKQLDEAHVRYALSVDTWRRFMGDQPGPSWEGPSEVSIGTDDQGDFAAGLGGALQIALRPWLEENRRLDPLGPRLIWLLWRVLVRLYYANREPYRQLLPSLAELEKEVAEEFKKAAALCDAAGDLPPWMVAS